MTPDSHSQGDSSGLLSKHERTVYADLADVLIPHYGEFPSATEANVPSIWIDEVFRIVPDFFHILQPSLKKDRAESPRETLERLQRDDAKAFEVLCTVTAGAYFLNPEVRRLIGYPGQTPTPVREDADVYVDLLAHVVDRGPIYRSWP